MALDINQMMNRLPNLAIQIMAIQSLKQYRADQTKIQERNMALQERGMDLRTKEWEAQYGPGGLARQQFGLSERQVALSEKQFGQAQKTWEAQYGPEGFAERAQKLQEEEFGLAREEAVVARERAEKGLELQERTVEALYGDESLAQQIKKLNAMMVGLQVEGLGTELARADEVYESRQGVQEALQDVARTPSFITEYQRRLKASRPRSEWTVEKLHKSRGARSAFEKEIEYLSGRVKEYSMLANKAKDPGSLEGLKFALMALEPRARAALKQYRRMETSSKNLFLFDRPAIAPQHVKDRYSGLLDLQLAIQRLREGIEAQVSIYKLPMGQ